jgi:hypothetical protein
VRTWNQRIKEGEVFLFVTPEYNHVPEPFISTSHRFVAPLVRAVHSDCCRQWEPLGSSSGGESSKPARCGGHTTARGGAYDYWPSTRSTTRR